LEVLLQRSLAWEPHRRLDSARTLANDLEHYCRGQRIQTQPFPLPYRLQRLAVGAAVRSRWTFSLLFMAAVGFALSLGGWMLNIGWRVQGHEYRAGRGRATPLFVDGDAREGIVPVGIGDETPGAVVRFAADRGAEFGGVTEDVTTWRAVHGFLLQRLSGAKPKAAVWDFYFQPPRPADDRLAAGITALERAGVPVVLAALEYEDDGTPRLSPAIVAALGRSLRHGAIVARDMVDAPGEVIVSVKRNEHTVIPSLVLATLAALLHPEERLDLEWPERSYTLAMLYETSTGSYLREQDRLELTKVFRGDRAEGAAVPKSLLGSIRFVLDPPDRWEARTVSYESLLTASDDELRRRCAGKLVIFGNLRTRRTDPHPDRHDVQYPSGMVSGVPGCYLIADAIAGLLDRRYMQAAFPLRPGTYFPLLLLAAAGCLAPIRLATAQVFDRRRNRCAFGLAAAALAAGGWLLSSVSGSWWAVHLGLAFFAFLAPLTGSLWVEFARGRHRILEAGRRELELATPTANEGTVTLASPPGIPRRETR
jgi:CHASE2 domain-containing sensor protein